MWDYIRSIRLVDYVLLFWIVLLVVPFSALLPFYNYWWLVCFVIWFVVVVRNQRFFSVKERQFFSIFVICFVMIMFITLLSGKTDLLHNMVELFQIPFFYFVFCYYRRTRDLRVIRNITIFIAPLFLIFSLTTIVALITNPFAARAIYASGDRLADSESSLLMGVGGYNLIYAVLLFAITLFYFIFSVKNKNTLRFVCLFLFAVFLVLVLFSNFFTALVLLVVSCVAFFVFRNKKLLVPILIIGFLILPVYKQVAIATIDGISFFVPEEGRTFERLQGVKYSLTTGTKIDEDVNTRSVVKKTSKDTFFEHPILGAIADPNMNDKMIGNHSTFWDAYARYGIFIGSFYIILFLIPFLRLYKESFSYKQRLYVVCYGVTVLLLMINNLFPTTGALVSYFVFPASFLLIKEQDTHIRLEVKR